LRSSDRSWHWTVLIGAATIIIAGWMSDVTLDGTLALASDPSLKVPVICPVRRFLGISCPACGLTRSVTHLLHGRFADSLQTHRLGWLVFLAIAFQIPYRAWRLAGRSCWSWFDNPWTEDFLLVGFLVLLCLNWLLQ
jgi:Protein of unknown function (DUF2752)